MTANPNLEHAHQLHATLVRAVCWLVDRDQPPPCVANPEQWTHDHALVRTIATHACQRCPLLELCGEYAVAARVDFGVFGGRDRTRPARRARSEVPREPDCSRLLSPVSLSPKSGRSVGVNAEVATS